MSMNWFENREQKRTLLISCGIKQICFKVEFDSKAAFKESTLKCKISDKRSGAQGWAYVEDMYQMISFSPI